MTDSSSEAEGPQDGGLLLRGLDDRVVALEQVVRLVAVEAARGERLEARGRGHGATGGRGGSMRRVTAMVFPDT
jgi:hypothetical protein